MIQDKTIPGAYISVTGIPKSSSTIKKRGVVLIPLSLGYGPVKQIIPLDYNTDYSSLLGEFPEAVAIALKTGAKVAIYRLNDGEKAVATSSGVTFTAKYPGTKGNLISFEIEDNTTSYLCRVNFNSKLVWEKNVATLDDLNPCPYGTFSGSSICACNLTPLEDGSDDALELADYSAFITAAESYDYTVIASDTSDTQVKALLCNFIKEQRKNNYFVQCVLSSYSAANNEGVISVKNGYIDTLGNTCPANTCVYYIAGITATADASTSNTFHVVLDAKTPAPIYSTEDISQAITDGEIVFCQKGGKVVVLTDINTLTSYTDGKNKDFSKNKIIRVLDTLCGSVKQVFENSYIGKVSNDDDGRDLFKADVVKILDNLVLMRAISRFDPEKDIEIQRGDGSDSVVVNLAVLPTDAMEKLYLTLHVN